MEIKHVQEGQKGYFSMMDQDIEAGRITYTYAGETKIIIDHTDVNDEYRGQSIGKKIVLEIVDFARTNHIKILPCAHLPNRYLTRRRRSKTYCFNTERLDNSGRGRQLTQEWLCCICISMDYRFAAVLNSNFELKTLSLSIIPK
ncbi:Uncharacterised protein [Sphingobacterium spiritivorum]|uniref:N-acetyltransferase domain-containing protein n=1 Tax=Sphingobacterium spiritivorum TaxID=258 RepID=A0A380BNJ7_SPHSI|nr:N-acetyltransferase [Sphingobacterium spiritivorum]SUJ04342.1 Uncharacterised protein [Sphingobacterium spiritivorum]